MKGMEYVVISSFWVLNILSSIVWITITLYDKDFTYATVPRHFDIDYESDVEKVLSLADPVERTVIEYSDRSLTSHYYG